MTVPVLFKSLKEEQDWDNPSLNPLVKEIVTQFAEQTVNDEGWLPVVTSIHRSAEEDAELGGTGIHSAWRAVDVRTSGVAPGTVDKWVKWINKTWKYDLTRPKFPVAYAKPHGNGPHLHIQVCVNTRRLG